MWHTLKASALVCLLTGSAMSATRVVEKRTLSLDGAKTAIAAAVKEAKRLGAPGGAIAVVDDGGHVLALERLDGTFTAAPNISIGKARTAAMFRKPTSAFEEIIRNGRTPMLALNDFTPLQGGVPIAVDGQVVGAIGVSGAASARQDEELAIAGANALTNATSGDAVEPVMHIESSAVREAFTKGAALVEAGERGFSVFAARRDSPGVAEVHELETDIFHVIGGSAVLVTGGTVESPTRDGQDGEVRGRSIHGGEARTIHEGDVIVVPRGTPHWFKDVSSPLMYYVVKVREG